MAVFGPNEVQKEMSMTQEEALNWIAKLFDEPPGKLTPETLREDISAWDSLGVLVLMSDLDSDFGIALSDEELQEIKQVNDILEILHKRGAVLTKK